MKDINLDKLKNLLIEKILALLLQQDQNSLEKVNVLEKVKCISYDDPKYNIDINNIEDLNLAKKF